MTKTNRTAAGLAPALFLGLLCSTSMAQEDPTAKQPQSGFPGVEELVVVPYTPQSLERDELYTAAEHLFGSEVWVLQNGETTFFDHFILLGDSIVVRDTPARTKEIVATLQQLEAQIKTGHQRSQDARRPQLMSREYTPRHVGANALFASLGSLRRPIFPENGGAATENVSVFDGQILHVRDTQDRVDEILAFVQRLDQPSAQATVSVLIISGNHSGESSPELPADLVDNLGKLVPVSGFELLATGLLRGSVRQRMELSASFGADRSYEIELRPEAYNTESGELALDKCSFQLRSPNRYEKRDEAGNVQEIFKGMGSQSFSTAATLRHGEYTVLGAVGADPVFVVLRMHVATR